MINRDMTIWIKVIEEVVILRTKIIFGISILFFPSIIAL